MQLDALVRDLTRIVGEDAVIIAADEKLVYSYDASFDTHMPEIVVLPRTADEVRAVVELAAAHGLPLVARGAGTGLSGGALPLQGGILLVLTRMRTIQAVDAVNRRAVVEAGVVNQHLVDAIAEHGLTYAPDPGSGRTSTIGGNIASNAGGPHCLAYGVTANHVTGVTAVLADGTVIETGSPLADAPGYDLTGVLVGSEGTLGVVTAATVQLMRMAESVRTSMVVFQSIEDASSAVSAVIAAGIVPTAMEMMDGKVCRAVEAAVHAGYPEDAGGVLLIEVEGLTDGLDATMATIEAICRAHHAGEVRHAAAAAERAKLWLGRKSALGAMGRIAPSYFLEDGVVPRHRLPEIMAFIEEIATEYDLLIGNFFHAGDGNIHPTILFDRRDAAVLARARKAASAILEKCIEVGGVVSGEHGIGTEKQAYLSLLYTQDDLDAMHDLKRCFDPAGRLNPGKIFPQAYRPSDSAALHTSNGHQPPTNFAFPQASGGLDNFAARLEKIVGRAYVTADDSSVQSSVGVNPYVVGDSAPRLIVKPGSVEEIGAVLRLANELRLGVAPLGGNSKALLGNPLRRYDVALSMTRLDAVNAHFPSDLTLTVQAGRTLAATNAALAAEGQTLPLDAPLAEQSTLGGILAAGPFSTGLRRSGYGTLRDMILGVQVVRPDGRVFRRGGMVVKNVAGYDMTRLQYGALGTLGVITELNLKVLPRPAASGAVLAKFADPAGATETVAALRTSQLQPVTVAWLDAEAATRLDLPATGSSRTGLWLFVRFDGRSEAVERQMHDTYAWAERAGATELLTWNAKSLAVHWPALTDFAQMAGAEAGAALLRINVAPRDFAATWTELAAECQDAGVALQRLGDAANGILWLRLVDPAPDFGTRLAALHATWLARRPQTAVAAAAPALKSALLAQGVALWGAPPQAAALMQTIRQRFDPQALLNPGRYVIADAAVDSTPAVGIGPVLHSFAE